MRIAMLTNNYRPFVGGVPISVERQAKELTKIGHQVTVFAPVYGDTVEDRKNIEEEDERSLERVIRFQTKKKKMENGMVCPAFYPREILEAFEEQTFDLIHIHHPMFVGTCGIYLKKKYGLPLIYTYHTNYEDYLHYIPGFKEGERTGLLKRKFLSLAKERIVPSYMKWFANQCDLVLAPSKGMQQMIRERGVRTRIEVLPTGLDSEFYETDEMAAQRIREQYRRNKKHVFITISRLEKEKNYEFLLRGIAEYKAYAGADFQLLIIGEGSQSGELKAKASVLGLEDEVTFLGNIPNGQLKSYLQSADLFLFASKSETQGIVLAEAMAAGLPVVAVHATGVDDIVQDGVNGYLTEENEDAWAKRIVRICQAKRYERMGKNARVTAEKYRAQMLALQEEMIYNHCSVEMQEKQLQYLVIH